MTLYGRCQNGVFDMFVFNNRLNTFFIKNGKLQSLTNPLQLLCKQHQSIIAPLMWMLSVNKRKCHKQTKASFVLLASLRQKLCDYWLSQIILLEKIKLLKNVTVVFFFCKHKLTAVAVSKVTVCNTFIFLHVAVSNVTLTRFLDNNATLILLIVFHRTHQFLIIIITNNNNRLLFFFSFLSSNR